MESKVRIKIEDKGGRPFLAEKEPIKDRIVELLSKLEVANPERVRKEYNESFRKDKPKLSWITLRRYLDKLIRENRIKENIMAQSEHGRKRTSTILRMVKY